MTHEPECRWQQPIVANVPCDDCRRLRAAYQRGRKDEQDYHAECECHRMGTWFEKNGTVEWCVFDGVEFVPQSVALAERQRGREDAADEILKAGYQRSLNLIQAVTIARGVSSSDEQADSGNGGQPSTDSQRFQIQIRNGGEQG